MLDDAQKKEIKQNIERELILLLKRVVMDGLDVDTAIENCVDRIDAVYDR